MEEQEETILVVGVKQEIQNKENLENKELKELEHEAMLEGNALMREYEDTLKRKEKKEMSLKEWKNNELNRLLMKKFGILKEEKKN